jgi:hypothetical protein
VTLPTGISVPMTIPSGVCCHLLSRQLRRAFVGVGAGGGGGSSDVG